MPDPEFASRRLPIGDDVLILRPETEADEPFLRALFRAVTLNSLGLEPDPTVEALVEMQYRSRSQTYAALWSAARRWVIEHDEVPVGGLIEDADGETVHIVDIAFLPQLQGQGLGTAVVSDVQARAALRGKAVTARVMVSNVASLALFRRRGFTGAAQHGDAQIGIRWSP